MKVIIDREEEDYFVVETENQDLANLPKILVPGGREGDVVNITIDPLETAKKKLEVQGLMDKLFD